MRRTLMRLLAGMVLVTAVAPAVAPAVIPARAHAQPAPADAAARAAQPGRDMTAADRAAWESLGTTVVSPDGRWLAYTVTREDDSAELRLRNVARTDSLAPVALVVPAGSRPAFSSDSRWLAWLAAPADDGGNTRMRLSLRELEAARDTVIGDVADYGFSADGRFIAIRGYPASDTAVGVPVRVLDLALRRDTLLHDVLAHEWSTEGALHARVAVERGDGTSHRMYQLRVLDASAVRDTLLLEDSMGIDALTWRSAAADLVVLARSGDGAAEWSTAVAWRELGRGVDARSATRTWRHVSPRPFMETASVRWAADGGAIFLGLRPPSDTVPASAAQTGADSIRGAARVQVWHSQDVDIVPERLVRAGIERNRSVTAVWHLERDTIIPLAVGAVDDVTLSRGRYALGLDGTPWDRERMFGPVYRDLYAVDTQTGEHTLAAARVQYQYGPSETGRYLLYVRDGHYWTYDTRTGATTNITRDVPTSFIDVEHDFTVPEKPPYGTGGWTTGDSAVLLHDRYDVWAVRPDGTGASNLTSGAAARIRHRRVWLTPDDRVVDPAAGFYVVLYGETTKRTGYARVQAHLAGGAALADRPLFVDAGVARLTKAADAGVMMFRMESFDRSADVWIGDASLRSVRRVTRMNPSSGTFAWGAGALLDFRDPDGRDLQAALFYPARYEAGRRYPLIVYPYEMVSSTLHAFTAPSERVPYNPTVWTQQGYFVLRPDVVFRARQPGVSSAATLELAVQRALATGAVDSTRIGIIGHSWGGYQAAFAVTQSRRYAAAVAGAPITNMISMYGSIYWNSGGTDARMFEIQQGRMEVPFWEDVTAYIANSPLFHVTQMQAPLLVAFGNRDGAVDWHQGIEMYNAARRADRQLVMLVYENENHTLGSRSSQVDLHHRILEWFGHYLKGEPAPEWIR